MSGTNADAVAAKSEKKLQEILTASLLNSVPYETAAQFREWFLKSFFERESIESSMISLEEFAVYFLNAVRQQTYKHLHTVESNDKVPPPSTEAVNKPIEELVQNKATLPTTTTPTPTTTTTAQDSHASPACHNTTIASTKCSTPLRRGKGQRRSIERSFGAVSNSSYEKNRSSASNSSFCLGDFIISSPNISGSRHGGSHKKKSQSQQQASTAATAPVAAAAAAPVSAAATAEVTPKRTAGNKPKKRVVPISISGKTTTLTASGDCSSPFGVHGRSFDRDCNNLFMQSPTIEVSDVAEARKSLKRDLNEVSTALKAATPTKTATIVSEVTQAMQQVNLYEEDESFCLFLIPNDTQSVLRLLANIYGLLMDMNFVINILNEFSFMMNLLNTRVAQNTTNEPLAAEDPEPLIGLRLLELSINSIYFAVCVLECQEHTLTQLDTKSLGVVLQCERLERLAPLLTADLCAAYEQKQALANQVENLQIVPADSSLKNVCFQEDSDSRKFFSSSNEFVAFKTQRDMFYMVLKLWEKHHLNPAWSFNIELAPKVREIFRKSEHPVNMTHFAKLFVSQLLLLASDKASPEDLGFDNDDVDLQKFNKLAQRLVAPSNFSVDYQFPREQAFFRDFIVVSRSVSFLEQLKMVIFAELITLNDSSLDHLNLNMMTANEVRDFEMHDHSEFVVEPAVLSSMLILAKFLGFVMALPYQECPTLAGTSSEAQNSEIVQRYQLKMRQLFRPPFDVCQLLERAMCSGRLLITLPWLVQYLVMLDAITLQLNSYNSLLEQMFALYAAMGDVCNGNRKIVKYAITPMSRFIVRCCLGWLFEQKPGIADEYYNFRANCIHDSYDAPAAPQTTKKSAPLDQQACAALELVLAVACPYLAEFRVSIMPAKYALTKYVSRSGRYRHITPSIAEAPSSSITGETTTNRSITQQATSNMQTQPTTLHEKSNSAKQRQRRLMESFLHAQNNSMRRLIVFLTERTYKCVVKDAQHQILLPSKAAADSRVNEISSREYEIVYAEVQSIYRNARADAIQQWDNEVPAMLRQRVTQGLEALLPVETTPIIKKAYAWRIQSDANIKIAQWRHVHAFNHDFYCDDLDELTKKLCNANTNRATQVNGGAKQSTELKLIKATPSISDLLEELQHWLYTTSGISNLKLAPENTLAQPSSIDVALIDFLSRLTDSFENVLPTIYYRLIGAGLIQVLHHLIASQTAAVTPPLINKFCDFCLDERMQSADGLATATTTPQTEQSQSEQTIATDSSASSACTTIYHTLISAPFIQSLNAQRICFDKLKELLRSMIQTKIISIDFVNELFIGIFKHDLCQSTLNETSRLLSELATEVGGDSRNGSNDLSDDIQKSRMFMEVLAEFSRDIEDF